MWQNITALMPPHSVYIETHLGGGAIMRNKRPATRNIGVDVDPLVIEAARGWGMSDLQLVEQDAVRFLNSFNFQGGELVYVDPPYLSSTKKVADTTATNIPTRITGSSSRQSANCPATL